MCGMKTLNILRLVSNDLPLSTSHGPFSHQMLKYLQELISNLQATFHSGLEWISSRNYIIWMISSDYKRSLTSCKEESQFSELIHLHYDPTAQCRPARWVVSEFTAIFANTSKLYSGENCGILGWWCTLNIWLAAAGGLTLTYLVRGLQCYCCRRTAACWWDNSDHKSCNYQHEPGQSSGLANISSSAQHSDSSWWFHVQTFIYESHLILQVFNKRELDLFSLIEYFLNKKSILELFFPAYLEYWELDINVSCQTLRKSFKWRLLMRGSCSCGGGVAVKLPGEMYGEQSCWQLSPALLLWTPSR